MIGKMDIILADDHALVREGLRPFLEELGDDTRVIEAASFQATLQAAEQAPHLALVILDLAMPGMNGLPSVQQIIERLAGVPVVILSGSHDRELILQAFEVGVAGFIPKTTGSEIMMNALKLVLAGERYLPSDMLLAIAPSRAKDLSASAITTAAASSSRSAQERRISNPQITSRLSNRERTVLELLVGGMTNKEIARAINLEEATVKIHVKNIYRKMGVANRAQAVRAAIQPGWSQSTAPSPVN